MSGPARPIADPRPSIGALLADPSVRAPLKQVLRSWAGRDPVDAAEDAGLLALALERRADERCGRALWLAGPEPPHRFRPEGGSDDRRPA